MRGREIWFLITLLDRFPLRLGLRRRWAGATVHSLRFVEKEEEVDVVVVVFFGGDGGSV